jgi:hypothetical protein
LEQRSRKRGRRAKAADRAAVGTTAVAVPAVSRSEPAVSRSEQRNAAVRATLEPFRSGERPWTIRVAVVVAVLIGAGDLVDVLVGGNLGFGGTHAGKGGVLLFSAMMLVCAGGMWRMRYWAVLAFQAILAFVVLFFSLALIRANNVAGVAIAVGVICGGGFLFFKLVRVLSRIQMPRRPDR